MVAGPCLQTATSCGHLIQCPERLEFRWKSHGITMKEARISYRASNTHPTATSEGIEIGRFKGAIQKLPILQVSFDGKLLKVLSLAVLTCRGKIDRPTLWNQIAINLGVFAQAANHHLHGRRYPGKWPRFLANPHGKDLQSSILSMFA